MSVPLRNTSQSQAQRISGRGHRTHPMHNRSVCYTCFKAGLHSYTSALCTIVLSVTPVSSQGYIAIVSGSVAGYPEILHVYHI
jgi:hypothetical protein